MSRLSRGNVPSVPSYVPRTFCPLNWNFHINRPKRPGCPWDVPNFSLGRFYGIPTTKFLYVIFLFLFFLSPSHTCQGKATSLAILPGLVQSPKPLDPGNTKKYEKIQNPPPRVGPRKYEKNTEKIRKGPKKKITIFVFFRYFFRIFGGPKITIFVFFRYFFRIFGGQPGVGGFVFFSVFFRISGIQGFLGSVPAPAGSQD